MAINKRLPHARRVGTDVFDEPLLQISADDDEMDDQRPQQAAQQGVFEIACSAAKRLDLLEFFVRI